MAAAMKRSIGGVTNLIDLTHEANAAAAAEHAVSVKEALQLCPKAIGFSAILSLALVMEGYDTALLGAFYSLPPFRERFGTRLADWSYQITALCMSGLSNGSTCGSIPGSGRISQFSQSRALKLN